MSEDYLDEDFSARARFYRVGESEYCKEDASTLMHDLTYSEFAKLEFWVEWKEDFKQAQNRDEERIRQQQQMQAGRSR